MSFDSRSLSALSPTTLGLPLVVLAGILWGTGGIAGSALQDASQLSPAAVGLWRLGTGAALLFAWQLARGALDGLLVDGRTARTLIGNGVLLAVFQACYFAGVALLGVAVATLVTLGSAPVMVAISHAVRMGEPPSRRTSAALLLAIVGLAGVVGGGEATERADGSLLGIVWCLASAGGFAALTIRQRRLATPVAATVSVTIAFGAGALVLLPVALVSGPTLPSADLDALGLVLYLGLLPTALAYAAYFAGLARVPATSAAVAAMLEPVTAAVLSAVLLGERLGPIGLAGSVAVVAAIAVGARGRPG